MKKKEMKKLIKKIDKKLEKFFLGILPILVGGAFLIASLKMAGMGFEEFMESKVFFERTNAITKIFNLGIWYAVIKTGIEEITKGINIIWKRGKNAKESKKV